MDGNHGTNRGMRAPVSAGVLALLRLAVVVGLAVSVRPAGAVPLTGLASEATFAGVNSLTIAIPAGGSLSFDLVAGQYANGNAAATITTAWDVNPGQVGSVSLYGYFNTPAAALAGAANIASSYVEGQMATGSPAAFTPFTQTGPVGPAGGSLLLFSEIITGINKVKTRSDNLSLRINMTTGLYAPVGNYTGTLRIQARAL